MHTPLKPAPWSRRWLTELLISVSLALVLVLGVRSSLIEAFKIPSGSMIPTLFVGDHIFVNKFAYGLKIPFAEWFTDRPMTLIPREGPKRGDIIVFRFPRDPRIFFIKRVVGIAGDEIALQGHTLLINQKPVDHASINSAQKDAIFGQLGDVQSLDREFDLSTEALNQTHHLIMTTRDPVLKSRRFGPVHIPPGMVFVLGDNRDRSNDSRYWGFVPEQAIRGKATVIWFSLWMEIRRSSGILPKIENLEFHPSRIGTFLK